MKIDKKIVGLLQARMGSIRLPGKVMMHIVDKPLSGHIFDRLFATDHVSDVILATTKDSENDRLVDYAYQLGIQVYRCKIEDDIAERLYFSAISSGADSILKVNGDCPLVDPAIMSLLTNTYIENPGINYVSNKINRTWPEGLSAEVISVKALQWCHENLVNKTDRELVASWIINHPEKISQISVENDITVNMHKLSVDTRADFLYVKALQENLWVKVRRLV